MDAATGERGAFAMPGGLLGGAFCLVVAPLVRDFPGRVFWQAWCSEW